MQHSKVSDPVASRRDGHLRRVLAHLEQAASEGGNPNPSAQTAAQMKVPLIGEVRRAETLPKTSRTRKKTNPHGPKPAQLDLAV